MALFKKKSKTNLGIDIGASAIKLVELESVKERYVLKTYGVFPFSEYGASQGEDFYATLPKLLDEHIVEMLKKLMQLTAVEATAARVSIPVYSSFSTLIDLPQMPEKEIASAIPYEAKKYIPVPLADVILDWSIIEKPAPDSPDKNIQILLVAVLKEVIEKYSRIVQSAGLGIQFMEAETFSLARSLVGNDKSAIVMADIGARSTTISIVDRGFIRISHNLEIGGVELTKRISEKMKLTPEKAEVLKKSRETWPELEEVFFSVLDRTIKEINKITNLYQAKYNRSVEKYIVCGGGANLFGLIDFFASQLAAEVTLGNPFARIVYPPMIQPIIKDIALPLAVAAGLAMRE